MYFGRTFKMQDTKIPTPECKKFQVSEENETRQIKVITKYLLYNKNAVCGYHKGVNI